jgi:hypothetical protein
VKSYSRAILLIASLLLASAATIVYLSSSEQQTPVSEQSEALELTLRQVALSSIQERTASTVVLELHGGSKTVRLDDLVVVVASSSGEETFRLS